MHPKLTNLTWIHLAIWEKLACSPPNWQFLGWGRSRLNFHLPLSTVYCVLFHPMCCGRQELLDLTMMKVPFQYKQLTYTDLQQIGNLLPIQGRFCAVHLPLFFVRSCWHAWEERRPKDHFGFYPQLCTVSQSLGGPWPVVHGHWVGTGCVIQDCFVGLFTFLKLSVFFLGTRNSLMVCTQIGNWSFILQWLHYFLRESKYYIFIYMYITTWFFICILSFPRTSLNIPSRGKR